MRTRRGHARLAGVLDRHAKRRAERQPVSDLGTIMDNGDLKLDGFEVAIPKADYLVSEVFKQPLAWLTTEEASGGAGDAEFAAHDHDVDRPDVFRPLEEGDRVFVSILDPDDDAFTCVVLARVESA